MTDSKMIGVVIAALGKDIEIVGDGTLQCPVDVKLNGAYATSPKLLEACQAGIIYSKAIESCANDPEKMASFCTAEGDTLDELYFNWINRCDKAIAQAKGKLK